MKKATIALIGALLVLMIHSSAWAQSGVRVDLRGSGFGFSVSDGQAGVSTFWYQNHQPYRKYSRPVRPYLGWGGYRDHHQPRHPHWTYQQHSPKHHGRHYRPQHGHGYGHHPKGRHHYQGHHGQRNHR